MKKIFIFIYSDSLGTQESVKNALEEMSSVIDWRKDLPNTFYLISESDAQSLANDIEAKLGTSRFLITEFSSNSQGRLTDETWHLLTHAARKPNT